MTGLVDVDKHIADDLKYSLLVLQMRISHYFQLHMVYFCLCIVTITKKSVVLLIHMKTSRVFFVVSVLVNY